MSEVKDKFIRYMTTDGEEKTLFFFDLIGEGANGKVYKGTLDGYGEVAIKVINKNTTRNTVYNELRISQANLQYSACMKKLITSKDNFKKNTLKSGNCVPNDMIGIITNYNGKYISSNDVYYEIYDLVDGITIEDAIEIHRKNGVSIDPDILHRCIKDLLYGLREMVDKGIAHRDIKPGNIMLHRGTIKYIDFGFACYYKQCPNEYCGSPMTSSPNMFYGLYDLEKDDVYALGVTIFFILTGIVLCEHFINFDMYEKQFGSLEYIRFVQIFYRIYYSPEMWNSYIADTIPKYAQLIIAMTRYDPKHRIDINKAIEMFNSIL